MSLRFMTAGESHGKCLLAILEGMVKGCPMKAEDVDRDLKRRQMGYGRGGRMSIEKDTVEILTGLEKGRTLGTPITIRIQNRDFKIDTLPRVTRPRPGHADLAGAMKYDRLDIRDILERASARETAARVAIGSLCRQFLNHYGIQIASHVTSIGGVGTATCPRGIKEVQRRSEKSPVRCCDEAATRLMIERIDLAKKNKDTLGGLFEVWIHGIEPSLVADKRVHARLAFGLTSIQAIKGVEIKERMNSRKSATGKIILTGAMKPISTLMKPLRSVDIKTKKSALATVERSDVSAVPACAVVAEAAVAFELAKCYMEAHGL